MQLQTIEGFSSAGKVVLGRTRAVAQELLPALSLTWAADPETSEPRPHAGANGGLAYKRRLISGIFVHLQADDPLAEFDLLSVKIEAAMASDVTFGGLAVDCLLDQTQFFINPETAQPLGLGRLDYAVDYVTDAANPALAAL